MATLELDGVTKVYSTPDGPERAVDDLSLTIDDGEFTVIVGPSGCGKTTTLRMIAGLESVTEGTIRMDGREVQRLSPSERDVAMVFQNYALYPQMTARKNIGYGLKHAAGMPATERDARVEEMAELLDITDVLDDRPDEMSGGQKQRVALGRAIVREPGVFLLDEPLSNLDAKLRAGMRRELQRIHEQLGITTVYVTHDQKEAMTMSDRIAVMNDGRLQQVAHPERAYNRPENSFVGEFLGSPSMNTFPAQVHHENGALTLNSGGDAIGTIPFDGLTVPASVTVGIRPEAIDIAPAGSGGFPATVLDVEYQGDCDFVFLSREGVDLTARVRTSVRPTPGETVDIVIEPDDLYVFDEEQDTLLQT